ncbi:MAG TPA: ABC transporter permease subunit [Pirellulaceae bacterium]|jgi:oligopeptide transport system permease protein|nr:ABC transporter permease subunit [Pirellulaceae bacterium]
MNPLAAALLVAAKRLGWIILTLWAVYTFSFFLMRAVPGGPFSAEKKVQPAVQRQLEARFHMDEPIPLQYLRSLASAALWLDFGPSMRLEDYTVNEVIAQGFPVSASLGVIALVLALLFGMTAGVISAVKRNSIFDFSFMLMATVGIAVPNFVLASLAIILLVFWLQLVPAAGWGSVQQLFLPALCIAAPYAAYIARLTRAGMLEVLNLDYIRTAYAKGLAPRTVVVKHALRGGILPVVSYLGPATAGILTGSLVLERIFNIPGMGSHFIDAAIQRDYTLALGMVVVYTLLLLVMNTLVDLSYAIIDPRVKVE